MELSIFTAATQESVSSWSCAKSLTVVCGTPSSSEICSWCAVHVACAKSCSQRRQPKGVRSCCKFLFPRLVEAHHKSLQQLRSELCVYSWQCDNSSEAKMLRDALKKAQQEATSAPAGVRLDACAHLSREPGTGCPKPTKRCGKLKTIEPGWSKN